jgi:hypothetical protein
MTTGDYRDSYRTPNAQINKAKEAWAGVVGGTGGGGGGGVWGLTLSVQLNHCFCIQSKSRMRRTLGATARRQRRRQDTLMHSCMSYEEEDTCMSYENTRSCGRRRVYSK